MTDPNHYPLLILGSGEAGKYLSWTLSPHYSRVALIESSYLGGSCPNIACLPSKNIIHSASIIHEASSSNLLASQMKIDMQTIRQRKRDMVAGLQEVHRSRFAESKVEVIWGRGVFVGEKSIEVDTAEGKRLVTADKIVISTGSRARIEDIPGLKSAKPLTHIEIMELDIVPEHLIILGGGYISLEFAQAMRRFGARVSVVERNEGILKNEDGDVVVALKGVLEGEGVRFYTSAVVEEVSGIYGESVMMKGTISGKPFELEGSHILCATGRVPNTTGIGLEEAGIQLDPRGFINTDERLETSSSGVYAVGDCAGSPQFTHVAFDDFRIVKDALLGKSTIPNRKSGRQIPFTLFTVPEFAHIGLRQREAKVQGIEYRLAKLPMGAFLKTRTLGQTTGFAKALIGDEDEILGFTALGVGAGELLPVVQLCMKMNLKYTDIADLIITHPTLSEGLVYLFQKVPAKAS
ncbi:FAD/NAD(P)-binding protein [Glarea lozoyensis ATCC 20868]|uniref:FAD/NAD(P)-binding protein n=1 Tax=Glarea lozoyensis (strain ATCC 20868 / MF5171) TaxID=1116229 RepID=S3DXA5_GLAL2|nr:FAD/NAD(P)-binding protein [Glarea lozoyensis ATCC 20868]EPE36586.1 FAD/NAD(P)-binding protein [Glarea lozoyensis ATCC 20868]